MNTLRSEVVAAAKAFLDEGQMALFEDMAERVFQIPVERPGKPGKDQKRDGEKPKDGSE
jgi:hypothetical protein